MARKESNQGGIMARSGCNTPSWIVLCIALCAIAQTVVAQNYRMTYTVGDEIGWTYLNKTSGKPADYEAWAASHEFFVDDVLKFVYEPKESDVYSFFNLESFTSCNISGATLLDNGTSGMSEWFMPEVGFYSFGSSKHCADGQKFRIFVNVSTVPFVPASPMAMPPDEDHEHMAPEPSMMPPAKDQSTPSSSPPKSWTSTPSVLILVGIVGSMTLVL